MKDFPIRRQGKGCNCYCTSRIYTWAMIYVCLHLLHGYNLHIHVTSYSPTISPFLFRRQQDGGATHLRKRFSSLWSAAAEQEFISTIPRSSSYSAEEAINLGRRELEKYFNFPLDDWQLEAGGSILMGYNVIVCAPTGSGKTVVGEMALHVAYDRDLDGIYTTPLKALSNQKFGELREKFGAADVALSTGDISINRREARLTVMTTEVYRNIAWRSSSGDNKSNTVADEDSANNSNDLRKNAVVVLDEFHYMGLPGRGGVWEESVITSPPHTQLIGLSATLPNAVQLAEWMESVTMRPTRLIDAPGARPVPLKYLFATREGLFPLFRNPDAGPGSPMGLLGYRGEGVASKSSDGNKKAGFGTSDEDSDLEKIPRGLQINPALKNMAQRRIQKVNRMLERQKEQQLSTFENKGGEDWDLYSGGRGRGRNRQPVRNAQLSSRELRREKERIMRREMRKAVPSLPILLARLNEKNLLPAIFFIFSRAGCDQAAETISSSFKGPRDPNVDVNFDEEFEEDDQQQWKRASRQRGAKRKKDGRVEDEQGRTFRLSSNYVGEDVFNSVMGSEKVFGVEGEFLSGSPLESSNWKYFSTAGLLDYEAVREVAGRINQFNEENPEIAFTDDVTEQLMFGIGRHHAGMLPAHKMLVETLFRLNLMKVVFATETLAAGINMPARTTAVCSLAKRGGGGAMELLETSNLLQMAGRAGRRGMDVAGTCVLVATPFEGEDIAAKILIDPIKPISSQFRPSYALAVNLIARGDGKLDVAKQLVSKSFANWGKQQLEDKINKASEQNGVSEILVSVGEERFLGTFIRILERKIQQRSVQFDIAFLEYLVGSLKDRELLKKASKGFEAASLAVELEKTTLSCLEVELRASLTEEELDVDLLSIQSEEQDELRQQVEDQRARVEAAEKKLRKQIFSSLVSIANEIMSEDESPDGRELIDALQSIGGMSGSTTIDGDDLSRFSKSAIVIKKKLRKLAKANPDVDPESLLLQTAQETGVEDASWDDMLAITKVLISYGCISSKTSTITVDDLSNDEIDLEKEVFDVTPAGKDVGMLSLENSLWCFLAMGGTFDVMGASSGMDEMKEALNEVFSDPMDFFGDSSDGDEADQEKSPTSSNNARAEALKLISHLRELSLGEMAGYVSCLVTGDTGRGSVPAMDVFRRADPQLQRSIQVLLDARDRFIDVQRKFSVDEKTSSCQFDLSHLEVVTAWADGCSWNEALEISGAAPGDLIRILGRAMDGLRQIGSLKFRPIRKEDFGPEGIVDPFSRGIHPDIRRICRDAAREMNRYPVKDPLPFEVTEEDMIEEDGIPEDDIVEEDDPITQDLPL
ncbi:DNA helicase [Nitzschia inconspicua]|uniref:DNA helicase n=1 Tax=Nitzschia inconspicua TaxID=303405 RepID=A0A9K3KSH6_9STRA|nr:DNA helicase [Nitzschia inconspicua]